MVDIFFLYTQRQQLCAAGRGEGIGDAFIEAGLDDADAQFRAVERGGCALFCAKHIFIPWGCNR
ncbi:hypothetical protein D3C81_1983850 [compost metagenome]